MNPIPTKLNELSKEPLKPSIIPDPSLSPESSPAIINIFKLSFPWLK